MCPSHPQSCPVLLAELRESARRAPLPLSAPSPGDWGPSLCRRSLPVRDLGLRGQEATSLNCEHAGLPGPPVVGDLTLQTQTIHSTHFPSARDPGFSDIMALMLDQLLSTLSEVPLSESSAPSSGG